MNWQGAHSSVRLRSPASFSASSAVIPASRMVYLQLSGTSAAGPASGVPRPCFSQAHRRGCQAGNRTTQLFVALAVDEIPPDWQESDLTELFSAFGQVESAVMHTSRMSGMVVFNCEPCASRPLVGGRDGLAGSPFLSSIHPDVARGPSCSHDASARVSLGYLAMPPLRFAASCPVALRSASSVRPRS